LNVDDLKDVFEDATPARRDSSLSVEDVEKLFPPRALDPMLVVDGLAELFPEAGPAPEPQPVAEPQPDLVPQDLQPDMGPEDLQLDVGPQDLQPDVAPQDLQPDPAPHDLMADLFDIVDAGPQEDPAPEYVEPDAELEAQLSSLAAAFAKLGAALGDGDPDA